MACLPMPGTFPKSPTVIVADANGMASRLWKAGECRLDQLLPRHVQPPPAGDAALTPVGTRQLAADHPGSVRILPKVHPPQDRFLEVGSGVERPQARLQAFNHVPSSLV